jgi:hypothetical protein
VTGSDSETYSNEGLVIGCVFPSGIGTKILIYLGQNSYNCHKNNNNHRQYSAL